MQLHTFIADSAADAVSQVRSKLGPEAVVLSVRRLSADGLARIWRKSRIEVLAHIPEPTPVPPPPPAPAPASVSPVVHEELFSRLRDELAEIRRSVACREPFSEVGAVDGMPSIQLPPAAAGGWRAGAVLERAGLLPRHTHRVMDLVRSRVGEVPPPTLQEELEAVGSALDTLIQPRLESTSSSSESGIHVFVGPPGSGKTTCVCKWLTQAVLVEGRRAEVWRLDGSTSNTAEVLSVYGEILNAPVFRTIPEDGFSPELGRLVLIDLPGGAAEDEAWMNSLDALIQRLPSPQLHLVLNAAYDAAILQKQVRAFAGLPLVDVSFTHLDEESRTGKIWNLLLGTNCRPGFLAGGQNIPGDFARATAASLIQRLLPSVAVKTRVKSTEFTAGKPVAVSNPKVIE